MVNVLLDEIHIKKNLAYKGGKFHGLSGNSNEPASTLQAFMISSLFSSNKQIAALCPVSNLTADVLYDLTQRVLTILHDTGYKVISLISDNNRVNRNMFEKLCGGVLSSSVPNPCNPCEPVFLLFDSVHLLRSIRNNWLSQKNPIQTFVMPSSADYNTRKEASLLP